MTQDNTSPGQTVLILFSSRFGHSRKVAERVAQHLQALGRPSVCYNLEESPSFPHPVEQYAASVVVASVRYGFFHKTVHQFVQEHLAFLNQSVSVFMPICLIARKPEKRQVETNVYARKFLEKTQWKPAITSITAGELRYPMYNFFDRLMIQLIMKMTKGETNPKAEQDFTDWEALVPLAQQIDEEIKTGRTR